MIVRDIGDYSRYNNLYSLCWSSWGWYCCYCQDGYSILARSMYCNKHPPSLHHSISIHFSLFQFPLLIDLLISWGETWMIRKLRRWLSYSMSWKILRWSYLSRIEELEVEAIRSLLCQILIKKITKWVSLSSLVPLKSWAIWRLKYCQRWGCWYTLLKK